MIPDQKPLLDNPRKQDLPNSEEILGGPEFQPAPGWGYKVSRWLKKYFGRIILPAIAITILILGINSYMASESDREIFNLEDVGTTGFVKIEDETGEILEIEEVTVDNEGETIEIAEAAEPGDGVTHLARRALKKYIELNDGPELQAEQKIYAEDFLKDIAGSQSLEIGDAVKFSAQDINNAIDAALALNEAQIQNLSKYVPLVSF